LRGDEEMKCEEFQRVLPEIIESGGSREQEAHLSSCEACSELVRDLKYIAEQAKLLLPLRDPNPRVWTSIQESLSREGLIREGGMSLTGQTTTATSKKKSWTSFGIMMVALTLLGPAVVVVNPQPKAPRSQKTIAPATAQNSNAVLQLTNGHPNSVWSQPGNPTRG
jgi:hypothetical protein